jgi:glycosyltransferase involved in cell wall biosynthesis
VVCLPTWSRWGVMQQRPQYLMKAFAASGHPVYFIDPGETEPRTVDGVHLVSSLAAVPGHHVILYVHFAPLHELFHRFKDTVILYDVYDDLSIFVPDEVDLPPERRVEAHHDQAMEQADLVLMSHPLIADRHGRGVRDLLVVENGVDPAMFQADTARPSDFPDTHGPVIGFHGMMSHWFDFDMLEAVARLRPDWSFVLVGPHESKVENRVKALMDASNISLIGERPSNGIAPYVRQFDVGAIWFQVNDLTRAVNPLKMHEYLAAGIPVVATPLPACVDKVGVRTASDPESFVSAISDALDPGGLDAATLREVAGEASWDRRLAPVLEWLDERALRRVP